MSDIRSYEPKDLWEEFYAISQIPRCSKKEEAVRQYLIDFAKQYNLAYVTDSIGNLVIKKDASPGKEGHATVVLQGHMDMVCEKNSDCQHNFDTDPIELIVDGEWLRANKTTLGADNGIAVAAALAVLKSESVSHGPIEALFTVDEETGMTGALNLDTSIFSGKILLNMDSEEDGVFYIGCAGGIHTLGHIPVSWEAGNKQFAYTLFLGGLKGGHSGIEIDKGLSNSIQLLSRFVFEQKNAVQLYDIQGGGKHNAIPRECRMSFVSDLSEAELRAKVEEFIEKVLLEISDVAPNLQMTLTPEVLPKQVFSKSFHETLLNTLMIMPHGVLSMSRKLENLVETSTNFAALELRDDEVYILTSQRSSVPSLRDEASDKVAAAIQLAGGKAETENTYPAWNPDPDAALLQKAKAVYKELFGKEAGIKAIHAGLECGVIGDSIEGIEMLSFGPDLKLVHTPEEKVHIESTLRFWQFLLKLLETL